MSEPVKDRRKKPQYRERTTLKKWIFLEKGLTYASLKDLMNKEYENLDTTRQYIYGIVSGRLTPSFEFARKMCKVLGVENVYTFFEPNEIHFPDFKTADKSEEEQENATA